MVNAVAVVENLLSIPPATGMSSIRFHSFTAFLDARGWKGNGDGGEPLFVPQRVSVSCSLPWTPWTTTPQRPPQHHNPPLQ